jgi:phosphoglycolate phosphatase
LDALTSQPPRLPLVAVFDFDGTLVESNHIKVETYFEITSDIPGAKQFLEHLLESKPYLNRYQVTREVAEQFYPRHDTGQISRRLAHQYTSTCNRLISTAPEVRGATSLLESLHRRNVSLFVSSATPDSLIFGLVQDRHWARFFKRCFGSPKSKEAHLQDIYETTNCCKDQMLMIGDSLVDYSAAQSFGCRFMGIGDSFYQSECRHLCARNLEDLAPTIFGNNIF